MQVRDHDARLEQIDHFSRSARIAALNDALRRHRSGGRLVATAGVMALGEDRLPAVLEAVASFTAFTDDNDPHHEHDCGSFEHDGERLFWKIDNYDHDLRFASPDPANRAVTTRVLTIMLAGEY